MPHVHYFNTFCDNAFINYFLNKIKSIPYYEFCLLLNKFKVKDLLSFEFATESME